ncbi:hypothetical protein AHAS_Ahas08G0075300 [Arachis hypogaea]
MQEMTGTHSSHSREEEAQKNMGGGWTTFPFIIVAVAGLTLASSGIRANLIVYLIQEFNIKSITAAQISNVLNGSTSLFPFIAAVVADSFFGSFPVALVSSCVDLLGTVIFALTASIKSLRPEECMNKGSRLCEAPSRVQYGVLYTALTLAAIGFGGMRFTTATLGANQFDNPEHQAIFFNWFLFTWYVVSVAGFTGIVYMEVNVSWSVGFWICAASILIGVIVFLVGYRYYRPEKPQGSALGDLARVLVASVRKWKSQLSSTTNNYYSGLVPVSAVPGKRLREVKAYLKKGVAAKELQSHIAAFPVSAQEKMNALLEGLFDVVEKTFGKEEATKRKNHLAGAVAGDDEGSQLLLLNAAEVFCYKKGSNELNEVALILKALYDVDLVEEEHVVHCVWYYDSSMWAKHDVLAMLSPTWRSSLEDAFLWIGGWRPTMAFHLLYSKAGLQFEAKLDELLQGLRTSDLGDLSATQLAQIDEIQKRTIAEEREITDMMATHQETVADASMVELSHAVS